MQPNLPPMPRNHSRRETLLRSVYEAIEYATGPTNTWDILGYGAAMEWDPTVWNFANVKMGIKALGYNLPDDWDDQTLADMQADAAAQ